MEQRGLQGDMIRYIMTNMDDAVCVTDSHGFLLYCNPAAEVLFGLSFGEGKKQKIWEFIPFVETNDNLIEMFTGSIQSRQPSRQAIVLYENKQGTISHLRVSLSFRDEGGGRFLVVISDLSELVRVKDAFSRYTSPQIAEYVLDTPEGEARDGESREVTILMSDLRGFTAMSASMEAKPLVEMLNHYFEKMVGVISSFQGTVIEFLGDGIFVVFGAPQGDSDHAAHVRLPVHRPDVDEQSSFVKDPDQLARFLPTVKKPLGADHFGVSEITAVFHTDTAEHGVRNARTSGGII